MANVIHISIKPYKAHVIRKEGDIPILESLSVTENGIYTPRVGVNGFDRVEVEVPNAPTGTINITTEGVHDVSTYANANVEIQKRSLGYMYIKAPYLPTSSGVLAEDMISAIINRFRHSDFDSILSGVSEDTILIYVRYIAEEESEIISRSYNNDIVPNSYDFDTYLSNLDDFGWDEETDGYLYFRIMPANLGMQEAGLEEMEYMDLFGLGVGGIDIVSMENYTEGFNIPYFKGVLGKEIL